ncbi:MAG: phenylalanine--tRNA ligase subunit beta [Bacteroidetes bacterium]|nr:phenylalanine--tRNA ligase subunit beta [Bacteroidota bacterium]
MIISFSWLKELVKTDASAQEIADRLSVSGLEVEHLDHWESVKGGLKGFVIGQVVDCAKHPNADKLSVTKVDIGTGELQPIVCGAPNVAAGQKVVVATVGTDVTVPGKGSFTIGEAKIRGEISRGMICAEDEMGLGNSHDGIMVLPENAPVGQRAAEYFGVHSDEILEIGLTANRGDAASHLGVARDVAALFETTIQMPKILEGSFENSAYSIEVENLEFCTRYVGLEIENVKVVASPEWMQIRLRAIGIEPKNMIVDATNYVLHELGQPLHAFDADKINGKTIRVRKAVSGEKFHTLDKQERELTGNELLIADEKEPIGFAGVMGELHTAVNENTRNIFLESACFHAGMVRKTARIHQLNTDASFRFERGTDIEICEVAAMRAAALILEYAGGEIKGITDYYPTKFQPKKINISISKLAKFSGANISEKDVKKILSHLGFAIGAAQDQFEVSVPSWCHGMDGEQDIYEEIMRIYGYDKIPFSGKITASMPVMKGLESVRRRDSVASYLTGNGFFEILNNSLSSVQWMEGNEEDAVVLTNPLSADMAVMRGSLLPGMAHAAAYNRNRKNHNIRFFEFGRIYEKGKVGIVESEILGILIGGYGTEESWELKQKEMDFYDAKSILNNVFGVLGISDWKDMVVLKEVPSGMLKKMDLQGEFWYAEIFWDKVKAFIENKPGVKLQAPPKFPFMRRDLSLVVDKGMLFSEINAVIEAEKIAHLKNMNVFDVFEGKPLDEGKKAIAIAFYLGAEDGTLTDEIADGSMKKLMKAFEAKGAVIRK